ncbi:13244_t:CDS:1, partial [Gigaspora rosea]
EIKGKVEKLKQKEYTVEMEVITKEIKNNKINTTATWKFNKEEIHFIQKMKSWASKKKQILSTISRIILTIPNNHHIKININQCLSRTIDEQSKKKAQGGIGELSKIKY